MGKWDQGEYNRVCNDKFKRLFYISQGKGAVDYDVDMERDWKQFIRDFNPEKKTVQACFTSLVNATKAPICPHRHLHRSGPSVVVPRAHRHYDTSNARTTRRSGRPTGPAVYDPGSLLAGMTGSDFPVPTTRLRPRPNDTVAGASDPVHGSARLPETRRRPPTTARYDPPEGYEWAVTSDIASPPGSQPDDDGPARIRFSPPNIYYDRDADTPVSLSGARSHEVGLLDMLPQMRAPFTIPNGRSDRPVDDNNDDPSLLDDIQRLHEDTTYPLFAPLDDAGPYPNEDIFDNSHEDDLEDGHTFGQTNYDPSGYNYGTRAQGYTVWSPPRPRVGLSDNEHDQALDDNINFARAALGASPGSYDVSTFDNNSGAEYTARARREVDEQVAADFVPNPEDAIAYSNAYPYTWADLPSTRRRQREDDDEDIGEQGVATSSDIDRRPVQRPRIDEVAGPSEGLPQRIRRSIPVASLLTATGSPSGSGESRRNGLVFDAETFINPDL